jgi:hypothetical protein
MELPVIDGKMQSQAFSASAIRIKTAKSAVSCSVSIDDSSKAARIRPERTFSIFSMRRLMMSGDGVDPDVNSRGRKVPRHNLREAIDFLKQIHVGCGRGPIDRENLAKALGHSSENGASNAKVGALTHFGLLERAGGAYRLSELAFGIISPTLEGEEHACLAKAALNPAVYSELYAEFCGNAIPRLLPNLMQRRFGMSASIADTASRIFTESLEYGGLLRNGVVLRDTVAEARGPSESEEPQIPSTTETRANAPQKSLRMQDSSVRSTTEARQFHVPLSRGRSGVMQLPLEMTATDVERIRGWLNLMEDVLIEPVQAASQQEMRENALLS